MTTITFREDVKIGKKEFKNIPEFVIYVSEHFSPTELKLLEDWEITPEMRKKAQESAKKTDKEFVNI